MNAQEMIYLAMALTSNVGPILAKVKNKIPGILEAVGLTAEAYAVLEISTPKEHANGETRPNVDTGRLRGSISHEVKTSENTVYVGTNVEYGVYVEMGTRKMRAYPYLRPAIEKHIDEYNKIIRKGLGGL